MSLIDERMQEFCVLDRVTRPDGYGGTVATYVDGAAFHAVATQLNSQRMEIAYRDGMRRTYAIFALPIVGLTKGMRIKRAADGVIFEVLAAPDPDAPVSFSGIRLVRTTMEVIDL